jgi:FkbM family methyltransferase
MNEISIDFLKNAVGDIRGICHVGSHTGAEVEEYVSSGIEDIIWIEANYLILNKLIKRTASYGKNQMWLPYCLYNADDILKTFNISNNEESSSILEFGADHEKYYSHIIYTNKISVLTKRLDTVVRTHADIDWIKMNMLVTDCQGVDYEVLRGCGDLLKSPFLKVIKSEFSFGEAYKGNASLDQITDYLLQFGFVSRFYFHSDGGWGDQFFIREEYL